MNTEYLLWFAALVVVAGAALLWLAIGDVPDIPTDPGADDPDIPTDPGADDPDGIGEPAPLESQVQPPRRPGAPSEPAGEDGLAGPG
jgi:hypothetical protein